MHTPLPYLDMSSNGNAWEGYEWVDGWPVLPPRLWTQQLMAPEPADEPAEDREMVVEPDSAANAATDTVDHNSTRHHETTSQVNAFLSSHAGTSYASSLSAKEDSDDDLPDDKQVDLGSGYSQCRAATRSVVDP
jgi:hypothetical protein